VDPDDLMLPIPSDPTDESPLPPQSRRATIEWPFDTQETILLALLYLAPFAIKWLTSP
jgi:hypothetical protein